MEIWHTSSTVIFKQDTDNWETEITYVYTATKSTELNFKDKKVKSLIIISKTWRCLYYLKIVILVYNNKLYCAENLITQFCSLELPSMKKVIINLSFRKYV